MPAARLFHNADCSKCRDALALLIERGVDVDVVSYLENPPTLQELRSLARMLGEPVAGLVRGGVEALGDGVASDEESVLRALAAKPQLLQRPILVRDGRAVIARPAARVLELL